VRVVGGEARSRGWIAEMMIAPLLLGVSSTATSGSGMVFKASREWSLEISGVARE
jgi:hypothetical protein